ncbi:apolipoprotein A-IV-like [Heteronotia binoei]|uniref:apolipoprotein A-IV-like n=1 Tax=Heteronotia binoei TaxID=13085 RepID=UPI00292DA034|nr:apolipoprotein A-IV-like [Heteronotia binoei]
MGLLTALLAVAVFTESQAVVLRDESRSQLNELKEELQEYMRNISSAVYEKQILFRRSELSKQLERYLQDNVSQIKRRWNKLQRELPAEIAEAYNLAATVPIAVVMKTYSTLTEVRKKLNSAMEELYDLLHPVLGPHATPVLEVVRAHAKIVSTQLQEADTDLNQKLKSNLDELATWLVPYAQSFRSQWGKYRKSLEPFTNQVQERLEQGAGATKGSWQSYVAPVQVAFRKHAKVIYDLLFRD